MNRKKLDSKKWIDMGKAREDNRPVLMNTGYQYGHSVTADGYRAHLVPEKVEGAMDNEEMQEANQGRFPDIGPVWNGVLPNEEYQVICVNANYLMDALHGMIDGEEGCYIAFGSQSSPIKVWNPRTGRKAAIMPMYLGGGLSSRQQENPPVPQIAEPEESVVEQPEPEPA